MIKDSSLINKVGDWKSEFGNIKTELNPINNATILTNIHVDLHVYEENLSFLGTFDSFNVIKDNKWVTNGTFNDAQKSWKQGVVDDEGYFKLTHITSQKVLTAIFPDKLILVDKGMYKIQIDQISLCIGDF